MILIHCTLYSYTVHYQGPHLPNDVRGAISLGFVKSLMQHFKDQKLLHRKYALLLLYHIRMLLKDLPTLVDVKVLIDCSHALHTILIPWICSCLGGHTTRGRREAP
jgi:hypothetical protein